MPNLAFSITARRILNVAQSINFTPATTGVVGRTAVLSAVASSGLPVSFSTTTPTVCTVTGTSVHYDTAGTCTLQADQAGNAAFAAASPVTANVTVSKISQIIAFSGLGSGTAGATATSGLPVVFSTTTPAICNVSGGVVKYVTAGKCILAADQAGEATYQPALSALISIDVKAAAVASGGGGALSIWYLYGLLLMLGYSYSHASHRQR